MMLVPDDNRPDHVRLGEFVFRCDQVHQTPVWFAFDILRKDDHPYHRLVWAVRALRSDPHSGAPRILFGALRLVRRHRAGAMSWLWGRGDAHAGEDDGS